jgi:hypothetical protein
MPERLGVPPMEIAEGSSATRPPHSLKTKILRPETQDLASSGVSSGGYKTVLSVLQIDADRQPFGKTELSTPLTFPGLALLNEAGRKAARCLVLGHGRGPGLSRGPVLNRPLAPMPISVRAPDPPVETVTDRGDTVRKLKRKDRKTTGKDSSVFASRFKAH